MCAIINLKILDLFYMVKIFTDLKFGRKQVLSSFTLNEKKCFFKWVFVFNSRQLDRIFESILMVSVIDTIAVRNLLQLFYCVFGKDILRHFSLLGGLKIFIVFVGYIFLRRCFPMGGGGRTPNGHLLYSPPPFRSVGNIFLF